VLYQGDLLRNYQSTGHNFFETDGVTPIPGVFMVTDQMRVFHWNAFSSKWIAYFDEGTGIPNPPPTN
jgi:hypothetical protein